MAATATKLLEGPLNESKRWYVFTVAFDNSYVTGGENIDLGGNERLDAVAAVGGKGGYDFDWVAASQNLLVRYADYDAVADGALIQVPNTTDLSALTGVLCVGIGSS